MPISHEKITISDTPVMVTLPSDREIDYSKTLTISIQNLDSTNSVLLGSASITTSSFGYYLAAGDTMGLELLSNEELYALAETDSVELAIMRLER